MREVHCRLGAQKINLFTNERIFLGHNNYVYLIFVTISKINTNLFNLEKIEIILCQRNVFQQSTAFKIPCREEMAQSGVINYITLSTTSSNLRVLILAKCSGNDLGKGKLGNLGNVLKVC